MIFIHYQEKVNACEILGLIILLVGLFMLMNGLLEAFPTEEQIEKVRMCGWLFTGVGGIWESICLIYQLGYAVGTFLANVGL